MDRWPGVGTKLGTRLRQWLSGWGFKQWRQAAVVTVLACTALFGGLDTVDKSVSIVKPGEEFNTGRFTATIERATLTTEIRGGNTVLYPEKPGRRYLGVVARIRNDSTLPARLQGPVELRDQPDSRFLDTLRFDDGSSVLDLGPGLTDQIAYVWELPEDALSVSDTITLRIWKQVPRLAATYGEGWVPSRTDYVQVVVPVGGQK